MQISSPLAYFVLWPLFCLLALILSSSTGQGKNSGHRPSGEFYAAIDGMRGILALNVFFHHSLITYFYLKTGAWELPPSNFYAQLGPLSISMFFFITGFLFWSRLIVSPHSLSGTKFLAKRLRRLMPAYLGSLICILVIVAYKSNFRLLVPIHNLVVEVAIWVFCGVPHNFPTINHLLAAQVNAGVFTTLRVEWAFYLVLPFLGWFATKTRLLVLLLLCAGWGKLFDVVWHPSALVARFAGGIEIVRVLTFWMIVGFSVGMITAHLKAELKSCAPLRHPVCTVVAVLLLLLVLFVLPPRAGLLESALLAPIFVMVAFGNDFHGLLTSRPIEYLGAISYSVYLLHGIGLYVAIQIAGRYIDVVSLSPVTYWAIIALVGGVVILLASLSYHFLEFSFVENRGPKVRTGTQRPPDAVSNVTA